MAGKANLAGQIPLSKVNRPHNFSTSKPVADGGGQSSPVAATSSTTWTRATAATSPYAGAVSGSITCNGQNVGNVKVAANEEEWKNIHVVNEKMIAAIRSSDLGESSRKFEREKMDGFVRYICIC